MAKSIFAIALLMAMVCISVAQQTSGPKINAATVNAVLTNDRVLSNYINCLLGELQCTRDGRLLKERLPDIIQNNCSQCDPTQRANSLKVINHVRTNRPQDWQRLVQIYDPKGLHLRHLNAYRV